MKAQSKKLITIIILLSIIIFASSCNKTSQKEDTLGSINIPQEEIDKLVIIPGAYDDDWTTEGLINKAKKIHSTASLVKETEHYLVFSYDYSFYEKRSIHFDNFSLAIFDNYKEIQDIFFLFEDKTVKALITHQKDQKFDTERNPFIKYYEKHQVEDILSAIDSTYPDVIQLYDWFLAS